MNNRDPQTYAIIGAAMAVDVELGPGFLGDIYHETLSIEMAARGVPFLHEVELSVSYKGQRLTKTYRADFLCYGDILVELKALPQITGKEEAQLIDYLKATGHARGLLLNFGAHSLGYERLSNSWNGKK